MSRQLFLMDNIVPGVAKDQYLRNFTIAAGQPLALPNQDYS